jgi:mono/diheme cytochrome c family protein
MNCRYKRLSSAALAVILLSVPLHAQESPASATAPANTAATSSTIAGDAAKGKIAFEKYRCFSCHGHSGDGGISPYPTQAGFRNPRPVVTGAHLAGMPLSLPAFMNYVKKPGGRMPAFGNNITDADLADIYAFLKSVPPSPDPKTTPVLNGQ